MLLCHGRVGTASLLESLQLVDNLFVPSFWHTDPLLADGSLESLPGKTSRLSEQCALPTALDNIAVGLINHCFPLAQAQALRIRDNLDRCLLPRAPVFLWTRNPVDNLVSSYKTYLIVHTIFALCEGNEHASGIYQPFNTPLPLGFAEFVEHYHYMVDYRCQQALYEQAGHPVHLRPFANLQSDLQGEVAFVLRTCGIAAPDLDIPQVDYPRVDHWATQVSFAFRNNLSIDGLPLGVGYFNPPRPFPNQGALTLEIKEHIFVAPDRWFHLPHAYKKRILAGNDPWQVIPGTLERYAAFEQQVDERVQSLLNEQDESRLAQIAREHLLALGIDLDYR
ncbi:hypothetical protein QO207_12895 [Pseudomonas sp. CAN2814]|uniref:hypothetical protein n=1 Tax=Pseudomonas sp. CAN1 TaxID=3046726 RepID=UPI002649EA09|nr:hypothetical protein [Pseudomonas sp. CAN1]MDN6857486.1 hypothetical protein [Pseudomonas sp. CAN1]